MKRSAGFRLLTVILCAAPLALVRAATNDLTTASDLLRQGYRQVIAAELAHAAQRDEDAAGAYRQAIRTFGRIQAEYPDWQTKIVNLRIAECHNAIAAMDQVPPGQAAAAQTNDENRLSMLLAELRALQPALVSETEFRTASPEKTARREIERLREELDDALRDNQTLLRRIAKLEASLLQASKARSAATPSRPVMEAVWNETRRLLQDSDSAGAMRLVQEAERVLPNDFNLFTLHGLVACRAGKFEEAVRVLKPLTANPAITNTTAVIALGSAYMAMGRLGDARACMEQAVVQNPSSAEAHFNLAQILLTIKPPEPAAAQLHYRRAVELGMEPDAEFETSLKASAILMRMKKKP